MPGDDAQVQEPRPRGPHAVYVGNVDNLVLEHNHAVLAEDNAKARAQVAVVVDGRLGPRILVRHNRLDGFRVGVRVVSEGGPPNARIWMVADNVCLRCGAAATGPLAPQLSAVNNVVVA